MDMAAFIAFKHEFERDAWGTACKHSCVAMVGIGEYLMVVPDLLLDPFPDKQIPPDDKEYSKNEDYVIILSHPIWNCDDAKNAYGKDERFVFEDITNAFLFHAISPVRGQARVALFEAEILFIPGELVIPFSRFSPHTGFSISHLESVTQACLVEDLVQSNFGSALPGKA